MKAVQNRSWVFLVLLALFPLSSMAATEYVTDRVMLGVHQEAEEDSTLIQSVPSGTAVEVLNENENFKRVRLPDGTEGWVSSAYLMKEKPSVRKYDELLNKYEKSAKQLEKISQQMKKNERELQVRRDELSNAKTTIRELKRNSKSGGTVQIDEETIKKLTAAENEIAQLKTQLAELQQVQQQPQAPVEDASLAETLSLTEKQNAALQARIELALASLSGEKVPTPEELAGIRPSFPRWYWGLLLVMIVIGVIGGIILMDYRTRKRHGGFRL